MEYNKIKQITDEGIQVPPGVEVRGEVLLAILNGMRSLEVEALQILGRHGISQPDPNSWYPLASLIEAWKEIDSRMTPTALYAMGSKIAVFATESGHIRDFKDFVEKMDNIYYRYHRGGKIGHVQAESVAPRRVRVVMNTPYPCDFERGVIYGFARLFPPPDSDQIFVEHDDSVSCRKTGGGSCTYHLSW